MTDPHERLRALSLELPVLGAPKYSYEPTTRCGNLLWVSGQISRTAAGEILRGRMGEDATLEDGRRAAEISALNLLARIDDAVGLANVEKVLKLDVWIAGTGDFIDQPTVAEGASQLLRTVLGDAGRHARTALPAPVLPQGALVELDATIAVRGGV
ncbi:RidA family protein [Nocardia sienata]|uniref:RidA family protein n=1 Tax=Nocardia sienata TaxID=248552 RepID=UPI0007A5081D|nr:RidA family protein [Nocardia sienata]